MYKSRCKKKKTERNKIHEMHAYAAHESVSHKILNFWLLTAIVLVITIMFPSIKLSLKFQLSLTAVVVSNLFSWNPDFC